MKKTWVIIAVAVVLVLAALLGVSRVVLYTDETGFHVADRNAAQIYVEKDAWNFQDIEIQAVNSNIEFITENRFGFEFMADNVIDTVYTNDNGKLTIIQSSKDLLFDLNLWSTKDNYVKVYIPERAQLKNIKIFGESGPITIATLKAEHVDIASASGNITLTLAGEQKDYNSSITAAGGKITVDGSVVETYQQENADATKTLKISAAGGDVTVNFIGQ